MKKWYINPIVNEICEEYAAMRSSGKSRSAALKELRASYNCELEDSEDILYVQVAMALALCRNHELTEAIAKAGIMAIKKLSAARPNEKDALDAISEMIADKESYGGKKPIRQAKRFSPKWSVGDTFAHLMKSDLSESCGLKDWYILMRKVSDYIDNKGKEVQVVVLSLCPHDKLPTSDENINSLGCLKMMSRGNGKSEYFAQILITKKDSEASFDIRKIGCFPDIKLPADQVEADVLTAMPLFNIKSPDGCMHYEMIACKAFKNFGIIDSICQ